MTANICIVFGHFERVMLRTLTSLVALLMVCSLHAESCATPAVDSEQFDAAIRRGADWLIAQQEPDGVWRSKTYGQLRDGVGATALAAATLSQIREPNAVFPPVPEASAPGDSPPTANRSTTRALAFLTANLAPSGHVRAADGATEYPTYATALTLIALDRLAQRQTAERESNSLDDDANADKIRRMRAYLVAAQVTAPPNDGGVAANDAGAWGLVGGDPADPSSFRMANVSTTRFALEALRPVADDHPETFRRTRQFLKRQQNSDGGFAFLSDPLDPLNKAGAFALGGDAGPFVTVRSYGTATADGLLAMLAAGRAPDEPCVVRAIRWLNAHPQVDAVPGFPSGEVSTGAAEGLFYYYAASLAHAMAAVPDAPFADRAPELAATLVARQRPDGSWANTISTMREDDPLIATSFALEALTTLRRIPPNP